MKRLVSLAILCCSLTTLAGGVWGLARFWRWDEQAVDVARLMTRRVTAEDIRRRVRQALDDDDPAEARMYLRLAASFGYREPDPAGFEDELRRLEAPAAVARRETRRFAAGFVSGQGDSPAEAAGALTSSFTAVGDLRDLWTQYRLFAQGQPVDEALLLLAGAGVGLSAATVAAGGVPAPARAGVAVCKLAVKGGHLSARFGDLLLREGRRAFDARRFTAAVREERGLDGIRRAAAEACDPEALRRLAGLAGQVETIRRASSTADAVHMLRHVDTPGELARLERLAQVHGRQTRGVLHLLGKAALGTVKVLRLGAELILSLAATALSALSGLWSLWRLLTPSRPGQAVGLASGAR